MNQQTNVFPGDQGVVWISDQGVITGIPTNSAGAEYSASVFQVDGELRFYALRKSPDLDRLVLSEIGLGVSATQTVVEGAQLDALGDVASMSDEQIIDALVA